MAYTVIIGDIKCVRTLTIVSSRTICPCIRIGTIDECPAVLGLKVVCIRESSRSLQCYEMQGFTRPVLLITSHLNLNVVVNCILEFPYYVRTCYVIDSINPIDAIHAITQVEACLLIGIPADNRRIRRDIRCSEICRLLASTCGTEGDRAPSTEAILVAVRTYVHVI